MSVRSSTLLLADLWERVLATGVMIAVQNYTPGEEMEALSENRAMPASTFMANCRSL